MTTARAKQERSDMGVHVTVKRMLLPATARRGSSGYSSPPSYLSNKKKCSERLSHKDKHNGSIATNSRTDKIQSNASQPTEAIKTLTEGYNSISKLKGTMGVGPVVISPTQGDPRFYLSRLLGLSLSQQKFSSSSSSKHLFALYYITLILL